MPSTKQKSNTIHTVKRARRRRREDCVSGIENRLIDRPDLKGFDKWVLIYLDSHPDDWEPNIRDICNHCIDGPDAVKAAFKRLKSAGFMQTYRIIEKGRVVKWTTIYSTDPVEDFSDQYITVKLEDWLGYECGSAEGIEDKGSESEVENPHLVQAEGQYQQEDLPVEAMPDVENPPHTNKKLYDSPLENKKHTHKKACACEEKNPEPEPPPATPIAPPPVNHQDSGEDRSSAPAKMISAQKSFHNPQHLSDAQRCEMQFQGKDTSRRAYGVLLGEKFNGLLSIGDEAWKLVEVHGRNVEFTELAMAGVKSIAPEGRSEAVLTQTLINKFKNGSRTELRNLIAAGEEALAKRTRQSAPAPTPAPETLPTVERPEEYAAFVQQRQQCDGIVASRPPEGWNIRKFVNKPAEVEPSRPQPVSLGRKNAPGLESQGTAQEFTNAATEVSVHQPSSLEQAYQGGDKFSSVAENITALNLGGIPVPIASTGFDYDQAIIEIEREFDRIGCRSGYQRDGKALELGIRGRWRDADAADLERLLEKLKESGTNQRNL